MERAFFAHLEAALAAIGAPQVEIKLERPNPKRGDLTTALPLRLAPVLGRPAMAIAQELAAALTDPRFAVEASAPGYLNLRLSDEALLNVLAEPFPVPQPLSFEPSFDWEEESLNNPGYFLRHSYARLHSLARLFAEEGLQPSLTGTVGAEERALLRVLLSWDPQMDGARTRHFALELAEAFQVFERSCRIMGGGSQKGLRFALLLATKEVLSLALQRLGITLPAML